MSAAFQNGLDGFLISTLSNMLMSVSLFRSIYSKSEINIFMHVLLVLLHNEMHNLEMHCDEGEACVFKNGQQVLESMSMGDINIGQHFAILIGLMIGFQTLAYIALRLLRS